MAFYKESLNAGDEVKKKWAVLMKSVSCMGADKSWGLDQIGLAPICSETPEEAASPTASDRILGT